MRRMTFFMGVCCLVAAIPAFAFQLYGSNASAPAQAVTSQESNSVLSADQFKSLVNSLDKSAQANLDRAYKAQLPKMIPPSSATTNTDETSLPNVQTAPVSSSGNMNSSNIGTRTPSTTIVPPANMQTPSAPRDTYTGFGNNQAPAQSGPSNSAPQSSGGWNVSY